MNWGSIIPVVVALLGIGSALATVYLAGRRQAQLEYQKEARLAVAQLTRNIGVATHAITWFTWKAENRSALLTETDSQEYDNDMKEIFPELTGSLAVLAAFSRVAYKRAESLAAEVYDLDEKVAKAATGLMTGDKTASAALAHLHPEARRLETSSKAVAAEIMHISHSHTNLRLKRAADAGAKSNSAGV